MLSHESVLHYIWKYRLYQAATLKTSDSKSLKVISPGTANTDAGSDFYNAKIQIDETLWAGNVEIHIRSSDWFKHQHQLDKSYDNVILHVVWIDDKEIRRTDGTIIPVLELKTLVAEEIIHKIEDLSNHSNWIACENQLNLVDEFTISQWLQRMLIE